MLNLASKTVTSQSATLIGKRRIYLDTDHSGLNKFRGEEDANFQLLLPELKHIVEVATAQRHRGMCETKYGNCSPALPTVQVTVQTKGKILVPLPPDEDFVGREGVMERITDILERGQGSPRVALVGLGGVG